MPYKASEILSKLLRAGFSYKERVVHIIVLRHVMEDKLMLLCIQKMSQPVPSMLSETSKTRQKEEFDKL